MKRFKSIDIFRGFSMLWMFIGHLNGWWLRTEDFWLAEVIFAIMDPLGASAFLFIAGVSTMISYRGRCKKAELLEDYNMNLVKNEYFFRALIILIIALLYNASIAIAINSLLYVWIWFFLLTIAISLFLSWSLLKTSKIFRIFLGAIIWIVNHYILTFLVNFRGQPNVYGVIFHILYNSLDLDPIFSFFSFFLFGTVIGDLIFETYSIDDQTERRKALKNNFLLPILIIGPILIISGVLIQLNLNFDFGHTTMIQVPDFLLRGSISWMIYSLGIKLLIFSTLFIVEEFEIIKTKKSYKFLFYFSYYSFTIYLAHNLFYFFFLHQLNIFNVWIFIACSIILTELTLRSVYKKWGDKASLKANIGKMAASLAKKIENKKSEN